MTQLSSISYQRSDWPAWSARRLTIDWGGGTLPLKDLTDRNEAVENIENKMARSGKLMTVDSKLKMLS